MTTPAEAFVGAIAKERGVHLRLAFPKGCRVRLPAMGRLVAYHRRESPVGTVMGYCRDGDALRVLWDGDKAIQAWHRDYVERV